MRIVMVSIITINYNGWQDTCELIDSMKQIETYPYEIIVVDNASVGDDVEQIRAAHPDIILVCSEKNRGFAGGNNLGYQYAKGNYIFFLNNDMMIRTPILASLVQSLQGKVAGVSPCIAYHYNPDQIQFSGYNRLNKITLKYKNEDIDFSLRENHFISHEAEFLHGGAMLVRKDVMEKVGKMTEVYFLFSEEYDWSNRIREAGFKLWYEADAIVYHKGSRSIGTYTPVRAYYMSRSRLLYVRRNNKGLTKYLSCMYLVMISMPKNIITALLKKEYSIVKALFCGTIRGLIDKKNDKYENFN